MIWFMLIGMLITTVIITLEYNRKPDETRKRWEEMNDDDAEG